mmetsp:Transcript_31864/g.81071  ORF Transcript_31864/g.81071 Transcript_31864/m.81071 type:complete len:206 (-) Transcript_31864:354-971(-)
MAPQGLQLHAGGSHGRRAVPWPRERLQQAAERERGQDGPRVGHFPARACVRRGAQGPQGRGDFDRGGREEGGDGIRRLHHEDLGHATDEGVWQVPGPQGTHSRHHCARRHGHQRLAGQVHQDLGSAAGGLRHNARDAQQGVLRPRGARCEADPGIREQDLYLGPSKDRVEHHERGAAQQFWEVRHAHRQRHWSVRTSDGWRQALH